MKDDVWIVSGGARGITPFCLQALARRSGGGTFYLLGRSVKYDVEPDWVGGAHENLRQAARAHLKAQGQKVTPVALKRLEAKIVASREIKESISSIEKCGGKAIYVQCDVTKSEHVSRAIEMVGALNITGLIHASGVLRDQRIEKKTSQEFDLVYGVKVGGLLNLLDAIGKKNNLKHLVVFSSLAGWGGNVGQTDYATANESLRKIARQANVSNTLSLCFGPWGGGGMVSPQLERYFISKGVEIIDRQGGAEAVARLICENTLCNTYLVGKWGRESQKHLWNEMSIRGVWKCGDWICDHTIRGNQVVPFTVVLNHVLNVVSNLHPGWRHVVVEDARVLKGLSGDHIKWTLKMVKMAGGQKLKCTLVDETNQSSLAYRMIVSNEKRYSPKSFDAIKTADNSVNSEMESLYVLIFTHDKFRETNMNTQVQKRNTLSRTKISNHSTNSSCRLRIHDCGVSLKHDKQRNLS